MAEAGAHLTSAATLEQPSLFEVLAQESLMEAVRPALRHAIKVLAESDPSRFGALWRSFDELYLLLDLLLQNHFLSHSSASFSENFYGLKRAVRGGAHSTRLGLPAAAHRRSLLLLCLAPYMRAKMEAALARQRDEEDFSIRPSSPSPGRRLYKAAIMAFPYISSAWQVWIFCQQLLFVFEKASTHNPLLWLAGVRLLRLNASDVRDMQGSGQASGSRPHGPRWFLSRALRGVALTLSTSLSLGVFFLQFLDWWYSSDNRSAAESLTALPAPPPPLHLRAPTTGRSCPLCLFLRVNATVLSTSGYVFCYRCIYTYVKVNRRCPLTGFPSELQHLIKIYSPES